MANSSQSERGSSKPARRRSPTEDKPADVSSEATSAEPLVTATALIATPLDPEDRARMVSEAAYYLAERRGFESGHELEDWLAAEAEVDSYLYRLYGEGRLF